MGVSTSVIRSKHQAFRELVHNSVGAGQTGSSTQTTTVILNTLYNITTILECQKPAHYNAAFTQGSDKAMSVTNFVLDLSRYLASILIVHPDPGSRWHFPLVFNSNIHIYALAVFVSEVDQLDTSVDGSHVRRQSGRLSSSTS